MALCKRRKGEISWNIYNHSFFFILNSKQYCDTKLSILFVITIVYGLRFSNELRITTTCDRMFWNYEKNIDEETKKKLITLLVLVLNPKMKWVKYVMKIFDWVVNIMASVGGERAECCTAATNKWLDSIVWCISVYVMYCIKICIVSWK